MILAREALLPDPQLFELAPATITEPVSGQPTVRRELSVPVLVPAERIRTDGKFFRIGAQKFHPKGVTYGPFQPTEANGSFPTPQQAEADFRLMQELSVNCLRVYHVPPRWFLDLAHAYGLKLLVE